MRTRTILVSAVFFAVLVYLFTPVVFKVRRLERQKQDLEAEIQVLSAKTQALSNELRLLKDDPLYIEQVARRTFNKSKAGEVVYRLVPSEEPPPDRSQTQDNPPLTNR